MRALRVVVILAGVIGHVTVNAQTGGAGADFSGTYSPPVFVGTIAVTGPDVFPFTPQGEQAFNAYNALTDAPNQTDDCAADPMPWILWSNAPMQIVQEADRIVLRYERGDTVRTVPLDAPGASADQPHTGPGYSTAHWAGERLSIVTTHMTAEVIRNNRGHPLSRQARVTERYWREPGENDLRMELLVEDPANYTEPFILARRWIWNPGEELQDYGCVSLGPRGAEAPDIDELLRMLEEL